MMNVLQKHRVDIHKPIFNHIDFRFHLGDDEHGTGAKGSGATQQDGAHEHGDGRKSRWRQNASQKQGDASLLKFDERSRLNNVMNNISRGYGDK
jgi:hypothetical protein